MLRARAGGNTALFVGHDGQTGVRTSQPHLSSPAPRSRARCWPAASDWIVAQTCVVVRDATAPGDVEVRNGPRLIVAPQARLRVDLNDHQMRVQPGSRLLVRPLGRVG